MGGRARGRKGFARKHVDADGDHVNPTQPPAAPRPPALSEPSPPPAAAARSPSSAFVEVPLEPPLDPASAEARSLDTGQSRSSVLETPPTTGVLAPGQTVFGRKTRSQGGPEPKPRDGPALRGRARHSPVACRRETEGCRRVLRGRGPA